MIGEVVIVFLLAVCVVLTIFGGLERGIFRLKRWFRLRRLTKEEQGRYSGRHDT